MAFEALGTRLLGRASADVEAAMGARFDDRVLESIDLAHHNEGLIGLENLISNLHEFEIAVTEEERSGPVAFADEWRLGERDRRLVKLLRGA